MTTLADYLYESLCGLAEDPTAKDTFELACFILPADSTGFEKKLVARAIDEWARAYVAKVTSE